MNRIIEAVKTLKAIGSIKGQIKSELNCIKIELRETSIRFACTDTRQMVYGSFDYISNQNLDLIINMDSLLKLKKPSKFEFFDGGIRVYTSDGKKTLKNEVGRYPDWEKITPQKIDSTLICDFSQLGTLLEALCIDVKVSKVGNELEIFQTRDFRFQGKPIDFDSLEVLDAFKMMLPFEGDLAHCFLVNYKVLSYLSKNKIKELKMSIIDHKTRQILFEKDGIKVLVMTYII